MSSILTFKKLVQRILATPSKHGQRLIAIDGGGGAGKTTFASCLQKEIAGSFIIIIDDFYRPPQLRSPLVPTQVINTNFDWSRFYKLVLEAGKNDTDISYQLYNTKEGTLSGGFVSVPRDATIIIEGVWSLQKIFADYYDYRIWLEAPASIRLQRGLSRDGEGMREVWEKEWIPIDERYREIEKPQLRAHCIIDSSNSDFLNDKIVLFQ